MALGRRNTHRGPFFSGFVFSERTPLTVRPWAVEGDRPVGLRGSKVQRALLRWSPSFGEAVGIEAGRFLVQVVEDLLDDLGIFNTGDDTEHPAAGISGLHRAS